MKITDNYYPTNAVHTEAEKIRVYNLNSPRTGEPVKNQFCIALIGLRIFQSYETTCLKWDGNILTVFPEAFGRSVTTSKYSTQFLREWCSFSNKDIAELKKIVKNADFGLDCPLYIDRWGDWDEITGGKECKK